MKLTCLFFKVAVYLCHVTENKLSELLRQVITLNIRLYYKLIRILILFINGLIITAVIFPTLSVLLSASAAKHKRDQLKTRWLRRFSLILNVQITVEGELPEPGVILVSNHISWLDIVVIGQCLPAYFVAKSDILSWPIIGYLARQVGTIFIRRGDKQHIRATTEKIIWLLKQNNNIIAFPEGTTTKGDEVLNFHSSLFQPALLTKSAILPVALQYHGKAKESAPFVGDDDFVSHLLRMLSLDKIEVRLCFLPAINSLGKNRQTLCHESRESICNKISGYSALDSVRPATLESSHQG